MLTLVASWLLLVLSEPQESGAQETYYQAQTSGIAALNAGRIDEAIEAYKECLRLRPNDPLSARILARTYSRKGEIDTALDWLEKSIGWGLITSPMDLNGMLGDVSFEPLRAEPRFQRLLERARQLPEATEPPLPSGFIDWTGGHRVGANSAEFNLDGSRIVSACGDGWGRIWDGTSGELLVLLVGRYGKAQFCAWANSDRQVLIGSYDCTLRFWDARTGDPVRVLPGPDFQTDGALSPDGRLIIAPIGWYLRQFDLQCGRGSELKLDATIHGVAFSPDGTCFATGSVDGKTRLFDAGSSQCLATLHQSRAPVLELTFSPDGRWLVTAGADGWICWLDSRTLELVRSFRAHASGVNSVVFRPDGLELLTTSADRTARLWDAADDSLRLTLTGHSDDVLRGSYRADGERILTSSADGTVRVWDERTGELLLMLGGRGTLAHRTVAFSPDGARLVTFDVSGAREWDPGNGSELAPQGGYTTVRFKSGRGGSPCEIACQEASWAAHTTVMELDGARVGVDAVFLSPDGRAVYSADSDDRGRLWNAESGHLLRELGRLDSDVASRWVSARFSPDGALLATSQHSDDAVHLWEGSTGEEIVSFPVKRALAVAFDPSGEQLAVAASSTVGQGSSVGIWNSTSGDRVHFLRSPYDEPLRHVVFRPDGEALAASSEDGTVQLWDLTNGNCLIVRPPFFTVVCSVAFSPDGKRLAAATIDHRMLLWDAESGNLLGTIVPGDEPGDWLAFTPSGRYHGTPASIARARLVQGAISYPLSCFAAALESPEQVQASFAGVEVPLPKLPSPPSLVVARPTERTSSTAERSAHLEALATEPLAGLAKIEVLQDGASVPDEVLARALTLENNERLARLDLRLPIPAGADETKITLQAVSARGIKSRPESFVVRYEPPKRELYVLALGVADYADDSLDLAYPVQDVDGLIARLAGQEDELFNDVHVERRVDRAVTNEEVLRLRDEFLLRAKPDDTIVVFIAGHGVRSDTGEYWFLTSASTPAKPYGGVQRSTLESLVTWDKLNATKRVLLLDTCHSGAAFGKGSRGERGIAFQQSEVDTLLERSSGLYILAATSDDGFAREQAGNGLFTRALLDGLEGAADSGDFGDKDGTVGIDELMHFARYAVLERSAGRQQPTFPRIEGGENFPLARCAR